MGFFMHLGQKLGPTAHDSFRIKDELGFWMMELSGQAWEDFVRCWSYYVIH